MGLVMSAYFSAILSTADSCLMASSGNVVSDIIGHFRPIDPNSRGFVRLSQVVTLVLGLVALLLASAMTQVLDLMLYSYAFMVSGLFVPVIGALYLRRPSAAAALVSMLTGGTVTVGLQLSGWELPLGLDPNVFGLTASAVAFGLITAIGRLRRR